MKIQVFFFSLLFFLIGTIRAQSPYHFNSKKEPFLVSGGITLLVGGYFLSTKTNGLTADDITNLNAADINSFDRFATKNYSKTSQNLSDGLFATSFIAPIPLIFKKQIRNDFGILAAMYAESFAITSGITLLTKSIAKRPRPFAYNPNIDAREKRKRDTRRSFFSGHTSISAMNSFFFAKVFNDYHPDSKYKNWIWAGAILLPAATGYARVEGGKHFPTDAIAGYVIGGAIGYLIPYFHQKERGNFKNIGVTVMPSGIAASLRLH